MWKVQLFELNYDEQEKKAVADVLESGWITMGERTQAFGRSFGEFLGPGAMAAAVSNGTAFLSHRGCGPCGRRGVPRTKMRDLRRYSLLQLFYEQEFIRGRRGHVCDS